MPVARVSEAPPEPASPEPQGSRAAKGRLYAIAQVAPTATETSVANALLAILEEEGVKCIFGVPGGPLTGLFEAMNERKTIRFVLAKHEAGAAFMAAAYARVTRSLAVCCATSGPGATNALTGIASAYAESLPVLLLTGQVATFVFGKGAIQESSVHGIDLVSLFRPVTKLSVMLPEAGRSPDILRSAIRAAMSGRQGPVHVSLPADLVSRPVRYEPLRPEEYRPTNVRLVDRHAIARAALLLSKAARPCILAGHGVALSGASEALLELAQNLQAPVATSPKGKGVFPENHPLALGVLGFGGQDAVEEYFASGETDVLLIVGTSLNEFVTNAWTVHLRSSTANIQIDLDPESIGKNYPMDLAVVGDAGATLRELLDEVELQRRGSMERRAAAPCRPVVDYDDPALGDSEGAIKPQRLVVELRKAMPDDAMLFVDNGNSIIWATRYFEARRPDTYFIDLGLSAMGSAVAGVVGGAMAARGRRAVALVGDGAFAMQGWEVHTAVEERLPIVWVVLNNGGHGMVHHGDTIMKGKDLGVSLFRVPLDIAAMATAVGARGVRVRTVDEFQRAIREALVATGPVVIDARIDAREVAPTLLRRVQTLAKFFGSRGPGSIPG